MAASVIESPEGRLESLRDLTGRYSKDSEEVQSNLRKVLGQTGKVSGSMAWVKGKVQDQINATREASGLLGGLGIQIQQVKGEETSGNTIERLSEGARPTLERALDLTRMLSALDVKAWTLSGEEPPILGIALQQVQTIFSQLVHALLAMPGDPIRQNHWAEGTGLFLDQMEGKIRNLVSRGRSLARETALRGDWLDWVREAIAAARSETKVLPEFGDRLDFLAKAIAENGVLGVNISQIWWQPAKWVNDPAIWIAADGWNLSWIACAVAHLEEVGPPALANSDILQACLVHDLGMALGDDLAWMGPGILESGEARKLEGHARRGEELVSKIFPGRHNLRKAVLWHHEKINGSGYPDGFTGPELSPLSKWLAVLEVYGGLQLDRPHRPGISPVDAWRTVNSWSRQGLLDPAEVARLELLGPLPPGTLLRMADGALGLVCGSLTQGDSATAWVSPFTTPHGQVLPVSGQPTIIDPRQVGGAGGTADITACHGAHRRSLLRDYCPWLG